MSKPADESDRSPKPKKNPGPFQLSVKAVVILVATCSALFWAYRVITDSRSPATAVSRGLRSSNAVERRRAAIELGNMNSTEFGITIPALTGALQDPDAEVRTAAAMVLSRAINEAVAANFSGPELRVATLGLLEAMRDRQPAVRVAAAGSISRIYSRPSSSQRRAPFSAVEPEFVVAALGEGINNQTDDVRSAAIQTLGSIGHDSPVAPPASLVAALKDRSPKIRASAAASVATFPQGVDRVLPTLFGMLQDERREVRTAAGRAMAAVKPSPGATGTLTGFLKHRKREVRMAAAQALGNIGPEARAAIPELVRMLDERVDPKNIDIATAFPSEDPACSAALALGKVGPESPAAGEVISALAKYMGSEHAAYRWRASEALAAFGPNAASAVPELLAAVKSAAASDRCANGMGLASKAIVNIAPGSPALAEAVAVIADAVGSDSAITRRAAVAALAEFDSKVTANVIPRLRALQNDSRRPVRSSAEDALKAVNAGP
jgi:HEAT repeat protein